jgi:predicted RNA-binding Zn ribbon-like protein
MATGVAGALGRILAVAFLAQLDGSWAHLKQCADETCTSVFYDRSKNRSGKWCSMQSCGNRNKVRAWRARQSTRGPAA